VKDRIIEFLKEDHAFYVKKVLKQYWKQDKYSYRTIPRPDYALMLITHGKVKLIAENNTLSAKAGDIVFLPKYANYDAVFEKEVQDYLINFDSSDCEPPIPFPTVILQNTPLLVSEGFETLIKEKVSGNCSSTKYKGLFYLLTDSILNCIYENENEIETIVKAEELLKSDCELRICDIAAECGISESGLRKKFKNIKGCSPTEYRLNFKINKAKYLLEATSLTVSEIADTLGFYDPSYFCKMFKTHTGLSLMQYAKKKQL